MTQLLDKCVYLLEEFSKTEEIMEAIFRAEELERGFQEGISLADKLKLKANIDIETGFWEGYIETPNGSIFIRFNDDDHKLLTITTLPAVESIQDYENYKPTDIIDIINSNKGVYNLDLGDSAKLRRIKKEFIQDFVIRNIIINNFQASSVAEMMIYFIRLIRRPYVQYHKAANYLWKRTPFKGAIAIVEAMKEHGFIKG